MSNRSQRRANRRNAQHSLLSPIKPAVLVKSGLDAESQFVLGESPQEFAQLQTEYFHHFLPANPGASPLWGGRPEERFQVDNIIRNEWFLRRFFRVEAHLWEYHVTQAGRSSGVALGEAFAKASPIFMRLQRRITAAENAAKAAKAEFDRLRQLSQPEETTTKTEQLASFLTPPPAPPASLTRNLRSSGIDGSQISSRARPRVLVGQALSPAKVAA